MCDLEADVPAICAAHGSDPIRFLDSDLAMLAEDGILDIEKGFIERSPPVANGMLHQVTAVALGSLAMFSTSVP